MGDQTVNKYNNAKKALAIAVRQNISPAEVAVLVDQIRNALNDATVEKGNKLFRASVLVLSWFDNGMKGAVPVCLLRGAIREYRENH